MLLHTGTREWAWCPACNVRFASKQSAAVHTAKKACGPKLRHTCTQCNRSFCSPRRLREHSTVCGVAFPCGQMFNTAARANAHTCAACPPGFYAECML